MYGKFKFGDAETATDVFERMPVRSVSSWNAMVSLYARQGRMDFAVSLFDNMEERSIVSWNAVIALENLGKIKVDCGFLKNSKIPIREN